MQIPNDTDEFYRLTLSQISDAVFVTDQAGELVFICPNVNTLFGFTQAEVAEMGNIRSLLGDNLFDLEELERLRELSNIERTVADKSGVTHHILLTVKQISIGAGTTLYTCRDITERRLAEMRLQESEARYRSLLDSLETVVSTIDDQGYFHHINGTGVIPFGTTEDMIGKRFHDFFPKEIADWQLARVREVLETGQGIVTEYKSILAGKETWRRVSIQPVRDGGQKSRLVTVNSIDISERKRVEEELQLLNRTLEERVKERTERVHDLYDNAPIGYHSLDINGNIIEINRTELDWLGCSEEEMKGHIFSEFLTEEGKKGFEQNFPLLSQRGWVSNYEFDFVRKDGTLLPVLLNGMAIRDEAGKFLRSRCTLIDITSRKQAEQALLEREQHSQSLLRLSRRLEMAHSYSDVLKAAKEEVQDMIGYVNVWVYLVSEDKKTARLLQAEGPVSGDTDSLHTFNIEGDPMLEEIVSATGIVVVEDARTDPRTDKKIVEMLGNRTIVNVPILLSDRILGSIGMGTFGDEGVRVPTVLEREYLVALASHMAVTLDRIRLFTERQQAKEKLQLRESYLTAIIENQPGLIWLKDLESRFLAVNKAFALSCELQDPELLLGKNDLDIWPELLANQYRNDDLSVISEGKPRMVEEPIFDHGEMRWFETFKAPVFDSRGKVIGTTGYSYDITERKLMENALRKSEERMNLAFRAAQDGIWDWNIETSEVFYSARYKMMLGYGEDELEPHVDTWKQLMHPDDLEHALQVVSDVLSFNREYVIEFRMRHKDGHYVDILSRGYPMRREPDGPIVRIVGTHHDLTERNRAAESLRQANSELAHALRIKDEFLASMSHELRTPLAAILGISESLAEQIHGPVNERQLRAVRTIETSGRHLLELISDILDLSRFEANQLKLEFTSVHVADVCETSLLFVRDMALKKKVRLNGTMDPKVQRIHADNRRLRQMLINLLNNAVKFTPEGGTVDLSVTGSLTDQTVRFTVADSGIGIAEKDFNRLFKPFVQLDSGLNRQYEGSGLGLALVDRMARLHGGEVAVESELGKGSRFTIILPWSGPMRSYTDGSTLQSEPVSAFGEPPLHEKAPLVLIAEDNTGNIEMLTAYLEAAGYRTEVAVNGQEALEKAREHRPAIILMDLQMPVMDGLEATRALRRDPDPELVATPVIALTALAMPGDREKSLEAGATDYLSKPFSMRELAELIGKTLSAG